jgi:hypothetical protein
VAVNEETAFELWIERASSTSSLDSGSNLGAMTALVWHRECRNLGGARESLSNPGRLSRCVEASHLLRGATRLPSAALSEVDLHTETATKAQANHQPIEVVINLALAFNWLIDDYRDAQRHQPLPQRTRFVLDNRHTDVQRELEQQHHQHLAAYLKHVNQMVADIHETHTILSLGINYPDYQRFRRFTPSVTRTTSDDPERRYRIDIPIDFATYTYTAEELSFLTTFVITTGLALARTARLHERSSEP